MIQEDQYENEQQLINIGDLVRLKTDHIPARIFIVCCFVSPSNFAHNGIPAQKQKGYKIRLITDLNVILFRYEHMLTKVA